MNLKEYFDKTAYKAVYEIGTPVRGVYQGIPFRGYVFNDTLVSPDDGPYLSIHLALPIMLGDQVLSVIRCSHEDVTPCAIS